MIAETFDEFLAAVATVDLAAERVVRSDRDELHRDYERHTEELRRALSSGTHSQLLEVATAHPVGWRFRVLRPAIPADRQLEIAIAALASHEAREGGTEDAA